MVGNALAGESTVSAGYARRDFQGIANDTEGVNVKFRYEYPIVHRRAVLLPILNIQALITMEFTTKKSMMQ